MRTNRAYVYNEKTFNLNGVKFFRLAVAHNDVAL